MTPSRPHPDLWYPIVDLLVLLRRALTAAAPDAFASLARNFRAQLAAITALVRRYIHVLAAEVDLLPACPRHPLEDRPAGSDRSSNRYRFPLIEAPSRHGQSARGQDPPDLQWELLMEAVGRLADVLRNPAPHARRLARRLRIHTGPRLRELPVRWSHLRRLPPRTDILLCRLDALARPEDWAGIDTS